MRRLRFFRVLLPALLLMLVVFFVREFRPRPTAHSQAPVAGREREPDEEMRGIDFIRGDGLVRGRLEKSVHLGGGKYEIEGIDSLKIARSGRGPLIVSAATGESEGAPGEQVWRFDERVVATDPDAGLELILPSLEYDEASKSAISNGEIRFKAPNLDGKAEGLVYSLGDEPAIFHGVELTDAAGGRLQGDRARLLDGVRDIELVGNVHLLRRGERLDAGTVRLIRGPDDELREATLGDGVIGSWSVGAGEATRILARTARVHWNDAGEIAGLVLSGEALLQRGSESLAAPRIEATRREAGGWSIEAFEDVSARGTVALEPASLDSGELSVILGSAFELRSAEARGGVRFESGTTRAESEEASFDSEPGPGEIVLRGTGMRKARLAREEMRVAGVRIVTDPLGRRLVAEERVEATLLPHKQGNRPAMTGRLFVAGDALHFVSSKLVSRSGGGQLEFTGNVRGWQGERNLAAESITVDQATRRLEAHENVSTRIPRDSSTPAVSADEYLQISAGSLIYDDAEGLATYTDTVRVLLAEGWLEANRLELDLPEDSGKVDQVRGFGDVKLELRDEERDEAMRAVSCSADRVVYKPLEKIVRLFGDKAPASVRRLGEGGETTLGRVLSYRLDQGTLEVESGDQGPARIRTSGG